MKEKSLCIAATLLIAATLYSGCSTDTSPSGNMTVGQQSSAAQTEETVRKETDTSNEKKASTQGGGNKVVNVSDYPIRYSQLVNIGTYRIAETNSMKDEVEKRGPKLIITDTQDNTAKQVSDVRDLIARNIDLLILSPREFEGLEAAFQTMEENPVPVVLVDRLAKGKAGVDYAMYTATDFVWEGRVAGEWLKDKTGGTYSITEFTGTVGSFSTQGRATGFAGVMDQNGGVKTIASQTESFERPEGQKVMRNLLQAHGGEVDAVFYHNDQTALGIIQAIKAAGYKPDEDILVIGISREVDSFKSVIAGEMLATVVGSLTYGSITFDIVKKILAGQEVPEQTITEGVVISVGNA